MDGMSGPARSWLFVPATRHDRFEKAAACGADRIIIDLEDAVAPEAKDHARAALASAFLPLGTPVYVRVNAASTPWFERDAAAAAALPLAGILLPKANTPEDVVRAAARVPETFAIVPIIETAVGAWNALDVARSPNVERLVFGALDFELDTGMRDQDAAFAFVRSRIAVASRVARVGAPIDSVCLSIDDEDQLRRESARGRSFGCVGKLCIHPNQVRVANAAFGPTDAEIEWATAVLAECASRPADAVFAFRGALVDRPVIDRARVIAASATPR